MECILETSFIITWNTSFLLYREPSRDIGLTFTALTIKRASRRNWKAANSAQYWTSVWPIYTLLFYVCYALCVLTFYLTCTLSRLYCNLVYQVYKTYVLCVVVRHGGWGGGARKNKTTKRICINPTFSDNNNNPFTAAHDYVWRAPDKRPTVLPHPSALVMGVDGRRVRRLIKVDKSIF